VLECRKVKRRFGPVEALRGIDASIPDRSCFALVGPNGAGKTTLLRMMAGVLPLGTSEGSIELDSVPRHQWRPGACAFVPESAPAPADMVVDDYLASSAMLAGRDDADLDTAVNHAIEACQLRDVRHRVISLLSRGYRQRVALAAAMASAPQVIVLDEPTSGLDPGQLVVFRSLVGVLRSTSTVILSSHHLGEVGSCATHVLVLVEGRSAWQGTIEELTELGSGSLESAYKQLVRPEGVPA